LGGLRLKTGSKRQLKGFKAEKEKTDAEIEKLNSEIALTEDRAEID